MIRNIFLKKNYSKFNFGTNALIIWMGGGLSPRPFFPLNSLRWPPLVGTVLSPLYLRIRDTRRVGFADSGIDT